MTDRPCMAGIEPKNYQTKPSVIKVTRYRQFIFQEKPATLMMGI